MVNISGFNTIPVGPVNAKFAFSCLEGDAHLSGDYLQINGNTISTAQRPGNNFFNSKITDVGGAFLNRTPASTNTLGYDAGIKTNFNGGALNTVIPNNATSAVIRLGTRYRCLPLFFQCYFCRYNCA